ncbi:MAG TPA: biotin/lipoyl-binding protein, partial [bacterium]|nr:biotin/lipoyl-binding protein [bacterium]
MKRNLDLIGYITVVLLFGILVGGCANGDESASAATGVGDTMAVNVRTQVLSTSSLTESLRLLGETEADRDLTFSAEIAGRLEYLAVDYGDAVRSGQILARIDYEMLKAQAEQASAAYDLAVKTYDRLQTLGAEELVTQQKIDEANAGRIQAKAQLDQAETALRRSEVK